MRKCAKNLLSMLKNAKVYTSTGCKESVRRSLPRSSFINFDDMQTSHTFLETKDFVDSRNGSKSHQIFFIDKNKVSIKNDILNRLHFKPLILH
jgi:hypothetical protein